MGDALGLLVLWLITTTAGFLFDAPWVVPAAGVVLLAAAVSSWLRRTA